MKIIANMMRTPDGTILRSFHRHDYVTYVDKNGKEYMLDGGNDYVRSSANGDEEYITITSADPFIVQRQHFCWGTRGKDGKQPIKWVPLKFLETDHIEAILETQTQICDEYRSLFKQELELRKNGI